MVVTDKQALVEMVKKAWAAVPYPGDNHIFTRDSYDDEGIAAYFSGTTWQDHKAESLRAHCSAISIFFTPEAYHYWLPAYLIAAVEEPHELSQGIDALLHSMLPERVFIFPEQRARLALLSNEQRLAVIEVVEHLERTFGNPSHPDWTEHEGRIVSFLRNLNGAAGA